MLFKLSNLNSNLALTLGYLNPALNNSALVKIILFGCSKVFFFSQVVKNIIFLINVVPILRTRKITNKVLADEQKKKNKVSLIASYIFFIFYIF